MKFKYAILYVENVAETLSFFENAFGFQKKMLHPGGDYGELDTGSTTLAFSSLQLMTQLGKSPARANAAAPTFELAFETDDVNASLSKALEAGATLKQAVKQEPWGQTTSYVSYNNSILIEICSPVRAPSPAPSEETEHSATSPHL